MYIGMAYYYLCGVCERSMEDFYFWCSKVVDVTSATTGMQMQIQFLEVVEKSSCSYRVMFNGLGQLFLGSANINSYFVFHLFSPIFLGIFSMSIR